MDLEDRVEVGARPEARTKYGGAAPGGVAGGGNQRLNGELVVSGRSAEKVALWLPGKVDCVDRLVRPELVLGRDRVVPARGRGLRIIARFLGAFDLG